MKRKKSKTRPSFSEFFQRYANLFWGFLAAIFWAGQILRLHDPSVGFPWPFFLKGLFLIGAAAGAYHSSIFKNGFSFLGMFPLVWLALSRFQWDLCASGDFRGWLWLVLFLLAEFFILAGSDGKKIVAVLFPLWVCLAWVTPVSLTLPFCFLTAPRQRFKNAGWAKWGGAAAGLVLFFALRGWRMMGFDWIGVFDFLMTSRFAAYFLLGWLGLAAFPHRGVFRHAVTPMFLLVLGFVLWPAQLWEPHRLDMLKWILVFFAGFGWESFRRDIMDSTWHGRAVWFALGAALTGGVF